MGYIKEKVAYVKGLSDGLSLAEASPEGRVLKAMLDVLEEIADSVEENEEALADINECVERLIEDNEAMNDLMFGEGDDTTFECPHCGEITEFDEEELENDEELICPHCNKPILPDFDEDEDADD